MATETKNNLLKLEIRAIERLAKRGKNKGNKFLAFKVLNKQNGYFEELKFNKKVKNKPQEQGDYILTCDKKEVNRLGTDRRKYPLTWVSKVEKVEQPQIDNGDIDESDLPF